MSNGEGPSKYNEAEEQNAQDAYTDSPRLPAAAPGLGIVVTAELAEIIRAEILGKPLFYPGPIIEDYPENVEYDVRELPESL